MPLIRPALIVTLGLIAFVAKADVAPWGQCGGEGWTGETTCAAGATCTEMNPCK
ncbi:hypothetical protein MPER_10446 [Moniliophthora perniciosa FA553]|nr:hypothetical protein MPER_10446 [Moniliophthora perniciosa FA553]